MGVIEGLTKNKKKEVDFLIQKYSSLEKLTSHFNFFLTGQYFCFMDYSNSLRNLGCVLNLERSHVIHSSELNSNFCVSYTTDFLNLASEISKIIDQKCQLQKSVLRKTSILESLGLRQEVIKDNSDGLVKGLDEASKNFMKLNLAYEKLCDKAVEAMKLLEKDVSDTACVYNYSRVMKKRATCLDLGNEIFALEAEINGQAQIINTNLYALNTLTQGAVNEIRGNYTQIISHFFSSITEANKLSYQTFSEIQGLLRSAIMGIAVYTAQEKSYIQEETFMVERTAKLLNEKRALIDSQRMKGMDLVPGEKSGSSLSISSQNQSEGMTPDSSITPNEIEEVLLSASKGDLQPFNSEKDELVLKFEVLSHYLDSYKFVIESQNQVYVYLQNKMEAFYVATKSLSASSALVFTTNGMASDSDSFYTLMLKTFNTQVIFGVKNYIALYETIKKRFKLLETQAKKSWEFMEALVKNRQKETQKQLKQIIGHMQTIKEHKLAYVKLRDDILSQFESPEQASPPHFKVIRENINNGLRDTSQLLTLIKKEARKKDEEFSKTISKCCEGIYICFYELSEDAINHCSLVSALQLAVESDESRTNDCIAIDKAFAAMCQQKVEFDESKQVVFKPKLDVEAFSSRLQAASATITKVHATKEQEGKGLSESMNEKLMLGLAEESSGKFKLTEKLARNFGVSQNEKVLGRYAGLLIKNIPKFGYIWVLESKLCFHPLMKLSSSDLAIKWTDVVKIERKGDKMLDKGGLCVVTKNGLISFNGIINREDMMEAVEKVLGKPKPESKQLEDINLPEEEKMEYIQDESTITVSAEHSEEEKSTGDSQSNDSIEKSPKKLEEIQDDEEPKEVKDTNEPEQTGHDEQ